MESKGDQGTGGHQVQVRLLGPVDVTVDGTARPVRGLRRKAVLAVLALHRGEVVSSDRLVDIVWGEHPPPTAANTLQSHMSHLRRVLGDAAAIRAHPPGYVLDLRGGTTDAEVAERLVRQGARSGEHPHRARLLQDALDLWRGRSLADVADVAWLAEQGDRLDRLWLEATRALIGIRLELGEHGPLLPDLLRLTREHPYDEQLNAHLMLALYRDGRQADALAAYHRLRRALEENLGINPSQPLRDLETAILRQDPCLDPILPASASARVVLAPVPAQLPMAVRPFTGRDAELTALDKTVGEAGVAVVCGTAGVGKTALAVHWAHRTADAFPDGQLYVNLRGFDPAGATLDTAEAVRGFLDALGVPASRVPLGPDAQAALYRSMLAGRRVLVILDNARDAGQVRPLLPGSAGCHVVVTSRDDLSGLVARDGARRIALDVLDPDGARGLLRALLGDQESESPAAGVLMRQCARLPLALRIAADLAASRPGASLADLVAELAGEHRRLDLLDAGADEGTALRAVFSWSERHLSPAATRLFWLVGLHPGPDVSVEGAAALGGADPAETRRTVETLARVHLVQRAGPDRWTMHDLLRAFARERATQRLATAERHVALGRLYDHCLVRAAAAMDLAFPESRQPGGDHPPPPEPAFAGAAEARAWLDRERLTLVALAQTATDDLSDYAVGIAGTLGRYLTVGYHNDDAFAVHHRALSVSEDQGDRAGQARALLELASTHARAGRYTEALEHGRRAIQMFRELGDPAGQARCLQQQANIEKMLGQCADALGHHQAALGLYRESGDRAGEAGAVASIAQVHWIQGRRQEAVSYFRHSERLFSAAGHRVGEGRVLNDLGNVLQSQHRYDEARDCHERALGMLRDVGDRAAEACALTDLGRIHSIAGRHADAFDHHMRALATFRDIEDPIGEVEVLIDLGDAHHRTGRYPEAADHHMRAATLARETDHRRLECRALTGQGRAVLAMDRLAEALDLHRRAYDHAVAVGDRELQARALDGMAGAHHRRAEPGAARRAWSQALDIYADLNLPEAEEVRAGLGALPSG